MPWQHRRVRMPRATAPRLAALAMVTGAAAAVLVLAGVRGDGGDSGGAEVLVGIVFIAGPFVCAAVTRSVAASSLVRPVGAVTLVLSALASVFHVAVLLDERGGAGLGFGGAAVVTTALLLGALVVGPHREVAEEPSATRAEEDRVEGPPLDVITPLHDARAHAARSAAAWVAVLAITLAVGPSVFRRLGWPVVDQRLDARVTAVEPLGESVIVTFEARDDGRRIRWTRLFDAEDSQWDVGDGTDLLLDDDGRAHFDQQFGLAGSPLFMPLWLVGLFGGLAIRRAWGLAVAWWDANHDSEPARLAYAAVMDDATRRTWRPLVAVWERDPTTRSRLAKPDAVYRADDETGEDLQSSWESVVVRRAWVDTGLWSQSKPRWVGVEGGVLVPHRRAFLGRWRVHRLTRRTEPGRVVALQHGPPVAGSVPRARERRRSRHRLPAMIAWRLLLAVAGVVLSFSVDDGGERIRFETVEVHGS